MEPPHVGCYRWIGDFPCAVFARQRATARTRPARAFRWRRHRLRQQPAGIFPSRARPDRRAEVRLRRRQFLLQLELGRRARVHRRTGRTWPAVQRPLLLRLPPARRPQSSAGGGRRDVHDAAARERAWHERPRRPATAPDLRRANPRPRAARRAARSRRGGGLRAGARRVRGRRSVRAAPPEVFAAQPWLRSGRDQPANVPACRARRHRPRPARSRAGGTTRRAR